ncbi:MAG: ABC transporter permease [Dehalococcoidia bacterium]|nr:ABC transporter permease [Dehalococcoidia bacterium]
MQELFGAPMSVIAIVLGAMFLAAAAIVLWIFIRNPILVRIGVRNVPRRRAQTVLIVLGLMLATAIIASAFTTGDSVSYSITKNATATLRNLDQLVRVNSDADVWKSKEVPDTFPQALFDSLAPALDADPDIDGVMPVVGEAVPVINFRSRQFEVSALLTGVDPARTAGFGPLNTLDGRPVDVGSLAPNEVYIDRKGAVKLGISAGDVIAIPLGPGEPTLFTVKGVADGFYASRDGVNVVVMMPLARAQALLHREGRLNFILVSNRGGIQSGVDATDAVQSRLADLPALKDAGLELFPIKQDLVDLASQIASLFVSIFTLFGLFSIGVGILLIFLIFTMLAAERKTEMGIARAIGMTRGHLVRMFLAEGAVYGLASAIVGVVAGIGLGIALVYGVAAAFSQGAPSDDFTLSPHITLRSALTAFFIGSVITFATVSLASWRTSKLNIVRAIRDIPEPQTQRAGKGTLIWGIVLALLGLLLAINGYIAAQLALFGLGLSLLPIGLSMVLRFAGVPSRLTLSAVGLYLLVFWLLPPSFFDSIRDDWSQDFSIFFISGTLVVTGAVLLTMNNSHIVLEATFRTLGRVRRLAPIVKSAVSYPMRATFRTGLSVAMFALVVFSIIVLSAVNSSFNVLFDDADRLAGGYEVIARGPGDLNPVQNLAATVDANPDLAFVTRVRGTPAVGAIRSIGDTEARLALVAGAEFKDTAVSGVDPDFVASNRFGIKLATAEFRAGDGFDASAVWKALEANPGYAVTNALLVPTRNSFNFDVATDNFRLDPEGFFLENKTMDPIAVTVRDLVSGKEYQLTVIAVLDDAASFFPFFPGGLFTSTKTLEQSLGRTVAPTFLYFNVQPGTPDAAQRIEAAFFPHGMDALDIAQEISDSRAANTSFNNLLTGFMALGLVVGIASLGVISARAVVERRHQIGVMRAIGFTRRMVQLTFLMESSFIAILGIALGIVLGLVTSVNVVNDIGENESKIQLVVPWFRVFLIAAGAYVFSLLTTFLPSRDASRVAPADALRYE